MNTLLLMATEKFNVRVADIQGGSLRNAIPRESFVTITVPEAQAEDLTAYVAEFEALVKEQFAIRWNITMGLFWIRPYSFINLDERNRDYLGMGKAFPPVDTMIASKLLSKR
jgi:di/tripeptidase